MVYDLLLRNLRLGDINPRICGRETCAPGHSFGPAIREYYLLHCVVSGKGTFCRDGHRYELQAGQIFVIRPGEQTFYQADGKNPWEYIWVGFDCAPAFGALLAEDVLTLPSAVPLFSQMVRCADNPAREWFLCARLYDLFAQLAAPRQPLQNCAEVYVQKAVNFIESNYAQDLKVEAIAAGLGLSRNYFYRIFRQHKGVSPQEYIISFRLAKAAAFMTELGVSQEEAAHLVGYPDVFSFSRMFKRKYGIPPGQYAGQKKTVKKVEQ